MSWSANIIELKHSEALGKALIMSRAFAVGCAVCFIFAWYDQSTFLHIFTMFPTHLAVECKECFFFCFFHIFVKMV